MIIDICDNVKREYCGTALQAAACGGHENIARKLLISMPKAENTALPSRLHMY